jgi:hypothetical protein
LHLSFLESLTHPPPFISPLLQAQDKAKAKAKAQAQAKGKGKEVCLPYGMYSS